MTITITHKGITVCIQQIGYKPEVAIQLIKETIDKINATCNNCTLEKPEGYGKSNNDV